MANNIENLSLQQENSSYCRPILLYKNNLLDTILFIFFHVIFGLKKCNER